MTEAEKVQLAAEIERLNGSMSQLQNENSALKQWVAQRNRNGTDQRLSPQYRESDMTDAEQIKHLSEVIAKLQQEIDDLRSQLADQSLSMLNDQLDNATQENEGLKRQIQLYATKIASLADEIARLNCSIADLKSENQTLKNQINSGVQQGLEAMTRQQAQELQRLRQQLASMGNPYEIENLRKQNEAQQAEIQRLNAALYQQKDENEQLQRKLLTAEMQKQIGQVLPERPKYDDGQSRIQDLQDQLSRVKGENQQLLTQLQDMAMEKTKLQRASELAINPAIMSELQEKLRQALSNHSRLENDLRIKDGSLEDLKRQLQLMINQKTAANDENNALQQLVSELRRQLAQMPSQDDHSRLQRLMESKSEDLIKLKQQLSQANDERSLLDMIKDEKTRLTNMISSLEAEIEQLRSQNAKLTIALGEAEDKIKQSSVFQQENGRLQQEGDELRNRLTKLFQEKADTSGELEKLKLQMMGLPKLEDLQRLKEKLSTSGLELDRLKSLLNEANSDKTLLDVIKEAKQRLEDRIQSLENQLRQSQTENFTLKEQVDELTLKNKRVSDLDSDNEKLLKQLRTLQQEHEELQAKVSKLPNLDEVVRLKEELVSRGFELERFKELLKKVEGEKSFLDIVKEEKIRLDKKIADIEDQLRTKEREALDLKTRLEQSEGQNRLLDQERQQLKSLLDAKTEELMNLQNKLIGLPSIEQLQRLKNELNSNSEEMQRLKAALRQGDDDRSLLQRIKDEKSRLDNIIQSQENQIKQLQIENSNFRNELGSAEANKLMVETLEKKVQQLIQENQRLLQEVENQRKKMAELPPPEMLQRLQTLLAEKGDEIEKLKKFLSQAGEEKSLLEHIRDEKKRLDGIITSQGERINQLENQNAELRSKLASAEQNNYRIAQLEDQIQRQAAENKQLLEANYELQQQMATTKQKMAQLPSLDELLMLKQRLQGKEGDLEKLREMLHAAEGEKSVLQMIKDAKTRLEGQIADRDNTINQLHNTISELRQKIAQAIDPSVLEALQAKLRSKTEDEQRQGDLIRELQGKLHQSGPLKDMLDAKMREIQRLDETHAASSDMIQKLKEKLINSISPEEMTRLKRILQEKDEELEQLKKLFSQLGDEKLLLMELNKRIKALEDINSEQNRTIQSLKQTGGQPSLGPPSSIPPMDLSTLYPGFQNLPGRPDAELENLKNKLQQSESMRGVLEAKLHQLLDQPANISGPKQGTMNNISDPQIIQLQQQVIDLQRENEVLKQQLLQQANRTDKDIAQLTQLLEQRNFEIDKLLEVIAQMESNQIVAEGLENQTQALAREVQRLGAMPRSRPQDMGGRRQVSNYPLGETIPLPRMQAENYNRPQSRQRLQTGANQEFVDPLMMLNQSYDGADQRRIHDMFSERLL